MNYKQGIIGHYSKVWHNTPIIKTWEPTFKMDAFCILEFPPNLDREVWTYATCGMSSIDDNKSIELHLFSPQKDDRNIELLTVIAHYHITASRLDLGHTVNFGRPWLDKSLCTFGLISLPYLDGPDLENFQFKGKECKFYWLIPITQDERNYKKKYGIEALEKKLESAEFNYLDPSRLSVL